MAFNRVPPGVARKNSAPSACSAVTSSEHVNAYVVYKRRDETVDEIRYRPIGVIHSPFKEPKGTPIQPAAAEGIAGTVEVFPEYAEGLEDVEGFSHVILIYHFYLCRRASLKAQPFMDDRAHGVFAMRGPSRPKIPSASRSCAWSRSRGTCSTCRTWTSWTGLRCWTSSPTCRSLTCEKWRGRGGLRRTCTSLPRRRTTGGLQEELRDAVAFFNLAGRKD